MTTTRQSAAEDSSDSDRARSGGLSQQAVVAELGQAALSGMSLSSVFELAVAYVCDVLDVEFSEVLLRPSSGGPLVLVAGSGWGDVVRMGETTVPCDHGSQAGHTLLSHEPVIIEDWSAEHRFPPGLLRDHGVVSGMSVAIPDRDEQYGVLGVHTVRHRVFTPHDVDFVRSVAYIIGGAVQHDRFVDQIESQSHSLERRLRYQLALADCAQALLVNSKDDQQGPAIEALLSATEADRAFVERNIHDPDLGFCSLTIAAFDRPGTPGSVPPNDSWELVPWDRMPAARSHLEKGQPYVVGPEELRVPDYDPNATGAFTIKSELAIPVFINDEWAGQIAFADVTVARKWTDEDVSLLTTAAKMIGAFWEREAARESLRRLVRSKDELIATISHELRTPLSAVVGFAQILHQEGSHLTTDERTEMIQSISEESIDLANIVDDLLVAAKAEAGTLTVVTRSFDLHAQAAQVLESWHNRGGTRIELTGEPIEALGDPARVRQILRNLISNAFRYGGKTIRMNVSSKGSASLVAVSDDGPGVPAEERELIFESYQRAQGEPGLTESMGLGLTISRKLARLMDGDLTYEHHRGESTFALLLPVAT